MTVRLGFWFTHSVVILLVCFALFNAISSHALSTHERLADRVGHAMYTIGTLNEMARVASIGLRTAVGIARSFLPGAGLYDAFQAVQVIASGQGGFWEALDIAGAAFPAMKLAGDGLTALSGLGKARIFQLLSKCNSFVAGTAVDTPNGALPIDCIRIGDSVISKSDHEASSPPRIAQVTRTFRSIAPAIIWLTFANGAQLGTTAGHEFFKDGDGWTYAHSLQPGDALLTAGDDEPLLVIDVTIDATPTIVYTLEVAGPSTFFPEGVWAHNAACKALRGAFDIVNVRRLPRDKLARRPSGRGNAPIGTDGRPVHIHHVDQNPNGPYEEILATDHFALPKRSPGLSPEERALFNEARKRYWQREWDSGRFD